MFYGTTTNNIKNNFQRNKNKFKEGAHFFLLTGESLKDFKSLVTDSDLATEINKFAPQLYLWTERGASRYCKILDTDKAWEQFDKLEETYFRMRETPHFDASAFSYSQFDVSVFSPEVQLAKTLLESIMRTELEQKRQAAEQERIAQEQARQAEEQKRMADEQERQAAEQKRQAQEQEQHTEALKTVDRKLEDIRDIVVIHPETWRKDCHRLVAAIAQKRGGANAYRDTNAEIFKLLEDRAHVSLKRRLKNRRDRMAEKGIAKSKRDKLNQMDIIEEDAKLTEIYIGIVKEMCVQYEVSPSVLEEAQSA